VWLSLCVLLQAFLGVRNACKCSEIKKVECNANLIEHWQWLIMFITIRLHHLLLLDECLVIGNLIKKKPCMYEVTQYDAPRDQHSWVSQFSNNLYKPITLLYLKIMSYPACFVTTSVQDSIISFDYLARQGQKRMWILHLKWPLNICSP
jgi:hypothetical protein